MILTQIYLMKIKLSFIKFNKEIETNRWTADDLYQKL